MIILSSTDIETPIQKAAPKTAEMALRDQDFIRAKNGVCRGVS
ncbi:hypothetical protein N836_28295 [Leptolyngbya sp. Heron Island J]|nr:hypothetical protein N836_28295 [Leptolyngbya sp. Heron Island J]